MPDAPIPSAGFLERHAVRGIHAPLRVASGGYVSQAVNATALSTYTAANQRFDFVPFVPARDLTIDQLASYVTTGVASAKSRLGIYTDTGAGYPGTLLADSGELDCSTSSTAIAGTVSAVRLRAGWVYWLAIISNSTQTLRGVALGASMPAAAPDGTSTSVFNVLRASLAYAALPATAPAGATGAANGAPLFRLRVA